MSESGQHTTPNAYTIKKNLSQQVEAIGQFALRLKHAKIMPKYHWHGHLEVNWLLKGRLVYLFDGVEVEIPKNQLVLFNASIPHRSMHVEAEDGQEPLLYNMYFPLDRFLRWHNITKLQQGILAGGIVASADQSWLDLAYLKCWLKDSQSDDQKRTKLIYQELEGRMQRMEVDGWKYLIPPMSGQIERQNVSLKDVKHVVDIMQYVATYFNQPITNTQIAQAIGLHPNYTMNLFRKVMHIPLKQYIRRMRLLRAHALMIDTTLPISAISFDSGFGSVSRFYEVFKAEYNMSPRAYRQKMKKDEIK